MAFQPTVYGPCFQVTNVDFQILHPQILLADDHHGAHSEPARAVLQPGAPVPVADPPPKAPAAYPPLCVRARRLPQPCAATLPHQETVQFPPGAPVAPSPQGSHAEAYPLARKEPRNRRSHDGQKAPAVQPPAPPTAAYRQAYSHTG